MYLDRKKRRVLFPNGTSVMTSDDYTELLIREGKPLPESIGVVCSEEAKNVSMLYGIDIGVDWDTVENDFPRSTKEMHSEDVPSPCYSDFPRYDEVVVRHGKDITEARIETEDSFFRKTDNIPSLVECSRLIQRFKDDGVVWGVGRGSACASLLLYILEVHDIDPLRYDIPFSELSKEIEYEY